jgi:hypothetical protein
MVADDSSAAGLRGNPPFHIADLTVTADRAARRVVLEVRDLDDGIQIAIDPPLALEVVRQIVAALGCLAGCEP